MTRRRDSNNKTTTTDDGDTTRQRQLDETINNNKRGSGTRSIGDRREAKQWQTKDNDNRGEGIGAMRLCPTRMAAGAPSNAL